MNGKPDGLRCVPVIDKAFKQKSSEEVIMCAKIWNFCDHTRMSVTEWDESTTNLVSKSR